MYSSFHFSGGYSGPFKCRYHERHVTKIDDRFVKFVRSYDCNAMYLGCAMSVMPIGDYSVSNPSAYYAMEMINNDWFGFMEVDIYTPDSAKAYFERVGVAPIFQTKTFVPSKKNVGEYMWGLRKDFGDAKPPKTSKLLNSFFW